MTKIQSAFLEDEGARGIVMALRAAGEECRFIGGCVRDAFAGLPVKDVDLATTALPEKVMDILPVTGFQVIPVGVEHGVVLAHRDGHKYEIATLREDVQTDGRHAIVAFTRDWELDAQRRDFTINALSTDIEGTVFDYTGGIADLNAHRVRFIGDAAQRIREDYLRILRFYRFDARFGEGDHAARNACREFRFGILQLSRERITEELIKLLSLPDPLRACAAMQEDHILDDILPQLNNLDALRQLIAREQQFSQQLPWYARLMAWGGSVLSDDALVLTRAARMEMKLLYDMDVTDLRPVLYHHGADRARTAVMLKSDDADLKNHIQQVNDFVPKEFPFQAEDILALGIAPGPRLGEILREVEEWWLKGDCAADAAACKAYAETLARVSIT